MGYYYITVAAEADVVCSFTAATQLCRFQAPGCTQGGGSVGLFLPFPRSVDQRQQALSNSDNRFTYVRARLRSIGDGVRRLRLDVLALARAADIVFYPFYRTDHISLGPVAALVASTKLLMTMKHVS